jgi:hypothetical protein
MRMQYATWTCRHSSMRARATCRYFTFDSAAAIAGTAAAMPWWCSQKRVMGRADEGTTLTDVTRALAVLLGLA